MPHYPSNNARTSLEDPSAAGLRPNLRVDVHVVTGRKEDATRVRRGSVTNVEGKDHVYVVRGGKAVRTPVSFGLAGFDSVEVVAGLSPGDRVILSDMSHYAHAREVKVR